MDTLSWLLAPGPAPQPQPCAAAACDAGGNAAVADAGALSVLPPPSAVLPAAPCAADDATLHTPPSAASPLCSQAAPRTCGTEAVTVAGDAGADPDTATVGGRGETGAGAGAAHVPPTLPPAPTSLAATSFKPVLLATEDDVLGRLPPGPTPRPWFIAKLDNAPPALKHALACRGWVETHADARHFHLYWKTARFTAADYDSATSHCRISHIPKSMAITKKDSLLRNLRKFRSLYGALYNFYPDGFLLPSEYTKFVRYYTAQGDTKAVWICKPVDLSRGRKIFLLRDIDELVFDQAVVVQRYVDRPLLVGGYKLDLRIYVLVASVFPLRAYMYNEGLVRFGTEKYEMSDLSNLFAHLTNSSINKLSNTYARDKDVIGPGCKWTLSQLWRVLQSPPAPSASKAGPMLSTAKRDRVWQRIITLVNSTLLILPTAVPVSKFGFELMGFDVLLDDAFKPWIVEVNSSPSLSIECETDVEVKVPLLADTIDLLMKDAYDVRVAAAAKLAARRKAAATASRGRRRVPRGDSAGRRRPLRRSTSNGGDAEAVRRRGPGRASSSSSLPPPPTTGPPTGENAGTVLPVIASKPTPSGVEGSKPGGGSGSGSGGGGGSSGDGVALPSVGSSGSLPAAAPASSRPVVDAAPVGTARSGSGSATGGTDGTAVTGTTPAGGCGRPGSVPPGNPELGPFGGAFPGSVGNFTQIFPFNEATAVLSEKLAVAAVDGATPVVQQDTLRQIVAELRGPDRSRRPSAKGGGRGKK